MNFIKNYLNETIKIIQKIDIFQIKKIINLIKLVKKNKGRIFFIGVGGSAANASHAVNDFRKIVGIECYTPVDNVSELTARTNDEGWESVFKNWLSTSNLHSKDMVFDFSVGGGDLIVVVLLEVESLVLLVVESVTIGSAKLLPASNITVTIAVILLLNIYF